MKEGMLKILSGLILLGAAWVDMINVVIPACTLMLCVWIELENEKRIEAMKPRTGRIEAKIEFKTVETGDIEVTATTPKAIRVQKIDRADFCWLPRSQVKDGDSYHMGYMGSLEIAEWILDEHLSILQR